MTTMVLSTNGIAAAVIDASLLGASYHPEIASQFVASDQADVQVGWRLVNGVWTAPTEGQAVTPAYTPPTTTVMDVPTFMMRLGDPAKLAAVLASTAPAVVAGLAVLQKATSVNVAEPFVIAVVDAMVTAALITTDDAAALLAPLPL